MKGEGKRTGQKKKRRRGKESRKKRGKESRGEERGEERRGPISTHVRPVISPGQKARGRRVGDSEPWSPAKLD